MGLKGLPIIATIALITLFNILIHLGFASATSLSSALIPVFISLTSTLHLGRPCDRICINSTICN